MSAETAEGAQGWLSVPERGAVLGIRFLFWLATAGGRWPARQFLRLLAVYYLLFDRTATRASRQWLERVHGAPATRAQIYQHLLRFAQVTLDRVFLLRGQTKHFAFTLTGHHHLEQLLEEGTGAILLGAHLGSYEAMRAASVSKQVPINILGYFANAPMVNALFEKLSPESAARVIHIEEGSVAFALEARERLDAGELVAVLGDRVGLNEKSVEVEFFGAPARFSAGPFLLAAVLKRPVLLVCGLYTEPNRYDLYCEPFAELVKLPRGEREAALEVLVQRYATRLEDYCRRAPDNWFNFYDFWRTG